MTTKDLLKLSPEDKKEVWFEKFLGWELKEVPYGTGFRGEPITRTCWIGPKGTASAGKEISTHNFRKAFDILDSLSAWNEFVEKPMREMGLELEIQRGLNGGDSWSVWTDRYGNALGLVRIQNGQIFLASLDTAFHIPKVLEIINKRSNQNEI